MTVRWQDTAQDVVESLGVKLSPEQSEVFYDDSRLKLVGGGEGGGKSLVASLYCTARSFHDYLVWGPSLYWVIGADFQDAEKELGGSGLEDDFYVIEMLEELGCYDSTTSSQPHREPWKIRASNRLQGHLYITGSAHDPTKIGREQPRGIVGAEVGRWQRQVWDRCYGRLARLRAEGSWGIFTGSFEKTSDEPWFQELWEQGQAPNEIDIRSFSMPSWANPSKYPGGRMDPAIVQLEKASPSPEYFMERYAGKPAPPRNAVIPEFNVRLHVQEAPIISDRPVYLFVDPAKNIYCVLFVQFVGNEVWLVDEVFVHQWTHEQVLQEVMMRPAWKHRAYDGHVMDVASLQDHFGLGTPEQAWQSTTGLSFITKKIPVDTTIERVRSIMSINPSTGRPRLRVDPKCRGFISQLGGGPSPIPGGGIWKMHNGTPEKKNDDAPKALGYGLNHHFGSISPSEEMMDKVYVGSYLG
jgi:hypothetical protein